MIDCSQKIIFHWHEIRIISRKLRCECLLHFDRKQKLKKYLQKESTQDGSKENENARVKVLMSSLQVFLKKIDEHNLKNAQKIRAVVKDKILQGKGQ